MMDDEWKKKLKNEKIFFCAGKNAKSIIDRSMIGNTSNPYRSDYRLDDNDRAPIVGGPGGYFVPIPTYSRTLEVNTFFHVVE